MGSKNTELRNLREKIKIRGVCSKKKGNLVELLKEMLKIEEFE